MCTPRATPLIRPSATFSRREKAPTHTLRAPSSALPAPRSPLPALSCPSMRIVLAALVLLAASSLTAQPMLSQPSLSPDGKSIAFVSGDDIWIAPASGGDAHILIAHPASESRPLFSPD